MISKIDDRSTVIKGNSSFEEKKKNEAAYADQTQIV